MASSTCFNSVLVDLEFLENLSYFQFEKPKFKMLGDMLRYIRTFHLCARKWGNNDASLGALLVRIEDEVSKIAQEIHRVCFVLDDEFRIEASKVIRGYQVDIGSFMPEIDEWYISFSDCSRQSYSPDRDELLEFIDSLLENLEDILCWPKERVLRIWDEALIRLLEALQEKLIFLKNFIRFTTFLDQSNLGHLLTHVKVVALNAAYHSYMCQFAMSDRDLHKEVKFKISGLLQRIKPVDPQVYEIYIQALTTLKLSTQSHNVTLEMDANILEDFIDSLLSNLWEILKSDTFSMFSPKDQLQILYKGLRFLRTILKEQPNNFDEKMWDLTGVIVCDAGFVICSLFLDAIQDGLAKEMGLVLSDLLERIKLIRAKFAEKSPEGSTFTFPKVDELGFIDFLLENLMELACCEAGSVTLAKHQIQTIQEELVFLRSFMGKIVELRNDREELQGLWNRVVELAYRVEFVIDSLAIGDSLDSSSMSFESITEEIKTIKLDALKIFDREGLDITVKKVTKSSNHLTSERSMPIIKDVIVVLDDEATSIIDRLERGAKHLRIVAIVGMPGLGKTTLATIVYNDSSIKSHFHIRAWCCVSQLYDKKNLLLEILTCIFGKLSDKYFETSEDDLALELYKSLKGRRYLIVLDDVWDIEVWNNLGESFPNDAYGSRIILTSRHLDVAPKEKLDQEPHILRQLTNDESWKLLKAKLFPRDDRPPALCELGMQIVERCKGLPLTIVILAGILATMEQDGWKEVVEHLSSSTVSSTEQCKNMLELSYRHLPDKLKPCLLYFGAFPEDQELTTKKLIWLWIAEGFVCKTQSKSLEDTARDYLMHLISRGLVMVSRQSSTDRVKTCCIHDLLHEFCVVKAKEERFFQLLQGCDELSGFNLPHSLRRLCIYSKLEHFKESRLFCSPVRGLLLFDRGEKNLRSCFNLSFIIRIFKLVRVLDLSQIHLGFTFPSEIELLVQLRYLAVRGEMKSIPSSIVNLSNLETLIVDSLARVVVLPDDIWNLKKLRHLQISDYFQVSFCLPDDNLDNSVELSNLDTCTSAILSCENLEKILRKFPNIRKLKVKLLEFDDSVGESNDILVVDYLSRLESLTMHCGTFRSQCQIEFYFPLNLRKLTLSGFHLPWCKISAIGNLPNLEVLKLLERAFEGEIWNMEEPGQFPKVRFLKLASLDIVRWTASWSEDRHLPCLVKLVLDSCYRLEELPSCLGDISTLQMIQVFACPDSAANSVTQIQEEQESLGNELKVLISSKWDSF